MKGATVYAYYLIHQTGVHSLFDNAYLYPDCLYSNLDVRQSLKDFGYFCVIVPATFVLFRSRCVLLADIVAGELWEWRPSFSGTLVSTGKPDDTSYEACPRPASRCSIVAGTQTLRNGFTSANLFMCMGLS